MTTLVKAVEADHLTVRFGDFTAVNDISFSVNTGEIFGFLGANGAGKTTTIRVLCGLLTPTEGNVSIAGIRLTEESSDRVKTKVGYMSQRFTLYNDLTVSENLEFTAALRKIPKPVFEERRQKLFEFIHFDQPQNTLVKNIPGGIKQELSLVAALLHEPDIIFLDEPTAGVSPSSRVRFWNLIKQLSAAGKTIFVTTHYMDEAEQCHRIALMRAGEIIALDSPAGLKTSAYPEPLYEVSPHADATGWLDALRGSGVGSVQPHGLRAHVSLDDQPAWEKFRKAWGLRVDVRPIAPSLEDVFIRLVEGKNR